MAQNRRRSGANFDQLLNKQWSIITRNQYSQLQAIFKKTDQRNGGISFYDMVNIIRTMNIPVSEERKDHINKEIAQKEIRVIDFTVLLNFMAQIKKERDENTRGDVPEENQYLDAFVALGGRPDKTGVVNKSTVMQIVKREFELSLDIENIIQGVPGDNLDYDTFCSIFKEDKEKNQGRLASAASQRSLRSNASINIEERDFQKFLAQYEGEEY